MSAIEPARSRGRPRDPAKDHAILAAAVDLFMERGFEASSMDAIAERAGVSKVTLYARFKDKDALFAASLQVKCEGFVGPELFEEQPGRDVRAGLSAIAKQFLALVTDPDAVAMVVLINREAARAPQLPRLFMETAVLPMKRHLDRYLAREAEKGRLGSVDPGATWRFLGAVKGEPHLRAMLGLPLPPPEAVEAHVRVCVDEFLAAHAARDGWSQACAQ